MTRVDRKIGEGMPAERVLDHLHGEVEATWDEQDSLSLLDRRTGFHVVIGPDDEPLFSDRLPDLLSSLGLIGDFPISHVRRLQRDWRDRLQREARDEALAAGLAFATSHVPYYRGLSRLYDPGSTTCVAHLSRLPKMQKPDIRRNFHQLVADGIDVNERVRQGLLSIARTSGTTDERIQVLSDMTEDRVPPYYEQLWDLHHGEKIPRTAVLTTPICSATECRLGRASMAERTTYGTTLYLNSTEDLFSADADLIKNIIDELHAFGPEFILANPVYLHWIGRCALEQGLSLPKCELILSSYQYLPCSQRQAIERIFDAPVYNLYTATELAGSQIGIECRFGNWHTREDHSILQIDCDTAEGFSEGIGDVLVSTVSNKVMPLFRYAVGDLGRLSACDCECALSNWQPFEMHGRRKDAIRLGDRRYTARQIDEIIGPDAEIDFYQCIQTDDRTLRVQVIPPAGSKPSLAGLRSRLQDALQLRDLNTVLVDRLDPEPSLKFRLTVPVNAC